MQETETLSTRLRQSAPWLATGSFTLHSLLSTHCEGKVCILGVGNRMKGDDGVGPVLIDKILGCIDADCIDAGMAPENFLEKIVQLNPETVLIVDAMDFGGVSGEIRIFKPENIAKGGISTHTLSLQMVCDYLKARIPVRIFLLGIQPKTAAFDAGLSSEVVTSIDSLAATLITSMPR